MDRRSASRAQGRRYIAKQDGRHRTAAKIVREIHEKADAYDAQPGIGTEARQFGDGYRYFVHKRWLVFYRPHAEGIEVVRVIDSSRDYDKLFHSEQ